MMALPIIAALALQSVVPDPAHPIRVEGPTRICLGQASFEADAGETVTLDYAGTHWAGIVVRGGEGTFEIRTGDMLGTPRGVVGRPVRGSDRRIVRYPTWRGVDTYILYDEAGARPVVSVQRRSGNAPIGNWVLDRIDVAESEPGSCNHRLDYGRRDGHGR